MVPRQEILEDFQTLQASFYVDFKFCSTRSQFLQQIQNPRFIFCRIPAEEIADRKLSAFFQRLGNSRQRRLRGGSEERNKATLRGTWPYAKSKWNGHQGFFFAALTCWRAALRALAASKRATCSGVSGTSGGTASGLRSLSTATIVK